jgi:hypothetical protein
MPLSTISPKQKANVPPSASPVTHGILRPDVSVSVSAHNTEMDPPAPLRELFTFSPFGLCCRQCGEQHHAKIKLEERSIRDHLKKHHMDSRMTTVRTLLDGFTKQVQIAKESCSIEPYRSDKKPIQVIHVIVGQCLQGKTMHFDIAKRVDVML